MAKPTQKTFVTIDQNGQVECLGMTFPNDQARREYFLAKLKEKLKDPEIRKIEGFPKGTDQDILELSDPPYFTACPNPFISEFLSCHASGESHLMSSQTEPFAADVSEGKNDPIYNAHSYHTTVPHKAIMRYILHYTTPGQVVFDGFCGTGMTGVAAQLCGDKETVESLGYVAKKNGVITDAEGSPISILGSRVAVVNDLSPVATFISHNYNYCPNILGYKEQHREILQQTEKECVWMYGTLHKPSKKQLEEATHSLRSHGPKYRTATPSLPWGRINYTLWSDVFVCSECSQDVVFWEVAVDLNVGKVLDEFGCPHCQAKLTKRSIDRAWTTVFDSSTRSTAKTAKQVPVYINYTFGGKRHEKSSDPFDIALVSLIESTALPVWFPVDRLSEGDKTRDPFSVGATHSHHFYTKRNLSVLATLRSFGLRT